MSKNVSDYDKQWMYTNISMHLNECEPEETRKAIEMLGYLLLRAAERLKKQMKEEQDRTIG